jgi:hypothetical protein
MDTETLPTIPEKVRCSAGRFVPAPEMADWIRATFIEEGGPLTHETHSHLQMARIGVLWTSAEYDRKGRRVLGKAETGTPPSVYGWHKGRMEQQVRRWFGSWFDGAEPDFVITLFAPFVAGRLEAGDAMAVCALVEHELCHCAQETDEYGTPQFSSATGRPKWTIAGHDAEVFVHEVARYGAHSDELERLREAFGRGPEVEEATAHGVCGCGAPVTA